MKSLRDALLESCTEGCTKEDCTKENCGFDPNDPTYKYRKAEEHCIEEGEVKSEDDFKEYAENKFKEVFGDKLNKERMDFTIKGLLKDNKDLVDKGEWGELVGMLNKSFGS